MSITMKPNSLVEIITSAEDAIRNRSLDEVCADASLEDLLAHCDALDRFWRQADNLYHRVRALFFLSSIHHYHLPHHFGTEHGGNIPQDAWQHLLERRFTEAIDLLLDAQLENGPGDGLSSALAKGYHELGFQSLADQVRQSVRTVRGNQWMFRTGHPSDHPLRFRKELLPSGNQPTSLPILKETTSVRMDFTHSAWSDIFFLGMDFPAGAKVINASVDLGVMGRDDHTSPPIECYLRVIDEPVLKLTSTDLNASAEITTIAEVFDFAKDYLGLLKAAVIASGIVPPGMEGCGQNIDRLLERLIGPGLGLEIVSKVNDIPKGSRLAVSTNLLGSLISLCMRATGQVSTLAGGLEETDRRIVAARAILGEWIGGSGGGWQDSGGVWPGIKLICGSEAAEGDPEFGVSRGRLLPQHSVFSSEEVSPETRQALQDSLVLVHGGMAQNVGPILEMVTEKYLLRSPVEWEARKEAIEILDEITRGLREGDIRAIGKATHRNFFGPLQKIIPWCTNLFTNSLVEQSQEKWGEQFWGFWMLGGMAGGGMGFIFDPEVKAQAAQWLHETMLATKHRMENRLPFAMDPVVYDFKINDRGSWSEMLNGEHAHMPAEYYALQVPGWLKRESHELSSLARGELEKLGQQFRNNGDAQTLQKLVASILPSPPASDKEEETLEKLMERLGFDREMHEQIQTDLQSGRFGLAQNRLPLNTSIRDVEPEDVIDLRNAIDPAAVATGKASIANGEVAVVTLAAGVGSRWTGGAGVVKGLHPFAQFSGKHRSFLEVHLAKSKRVSKEFASPENTIPHIFTTGYMTHAPTEEHLAATDNYRYPGQVLLSPGRYVGQRTIPMIRDLHFTWQETQQQVLDEQQQKVRSSARTALLKWAQQMGPGSNYTDNLPMQCLHPVGHWYEVPNLLRNGTLRDLLAQRPQLKYLMLHNIDTLGANVDPGILGTHIENGNCLSVEVIQRRLDDRGGGLARVNGYPRLVEGLALPREEDEFKLTYYNSLTTWINIDHLLNKMGLSRKDLDDQGKVERSVRELAEQMPTYITLKDVKKRWGNGQEDVFPVAQSEKLWGDMTALADISCDFLVIPLPRGQQLKEQAQLDGWLRDGTADYVNRLCDWG